MAVKVTGVHHIALKACGIEAFQKTIAFYHDILGLPSSAPGARARISA